MTTPISIFRNERLGPSVSGRKLYKLIYVSKSKRDIFSDWFLERIKRLELSEGIDYVRTSVFLPNTPSRRASIEYVVSVAAAKRIAAFQQASLGAGVITYLESLEASSDDKTALQSTEFPSFDVSSPVEAEATQADVLPSPTIESETPQNPCLNF